MSRARLGLESHGLLKPQAGLSKTAPAQLSGRALQDGSSSARARLGLSWSLHVVGSPSDCRQGFHGACSDGSGLVGIKM